MTHGLEAFQNDRAMHRFFEYGLLEQYRPEVASLARFAHGVDVATFYLCVAFEQGSVRFELDFAPERRPRKTTSWFQRLADDTFRRFRLLRRALLLEWTPPADVEPLAYSAFSSLCELAPAANLSLKALYISERSHAVERLLSQLDLEVRQIEEAVKLADDVGAQLAQASDIEDAARLESTQNYILSTAGESLSLSDAAKRLGTTRQNLHKRIVSGSALGVMRGRELVVPAVQFIEVGEGAKIVSNLRPIASLFRETKAGDWSFLQFLTQHDPVLNGTPIELLKKGQIDSVVAATRAFLGYDEE